MIVDYLWIFIALFDSLLCSMQNLHDIRMLLQETYRVLKNGFLFNFRY